MATTYRGTYLSAPWSRSVARPRPRGAVMADAVTAVPILRVGDLAPWTERWDRLAHDCGALFFQSPQWLASWMTVLEPAAAVTLLVDGPVDDPTGLLAICTATRRIHPRLPVGISYVGIAGSGLGAADHLGPIARDDASARRLIHAAVAHAGRTPLVFANLADRFRGVVAGLPGAVAVTDKQCPVLDLEHVSSTADIWSPRLRKNLRRRNRLLADGGLERRWVHGGDAAVEALGHLRRLHLARWRARGTPGMFDDQRMAFLVDLVGRGAADDSGVWLEVIEGPSGPVAALVGFEYGRSFCAYKTGWDPDLRSYGMGILLHSGAVERAVDRGLARYDFLRGIEEHKGTLGGISHLNTTYVVPNGATGRVLVARDRLSELRSSWVETRHHRRP